MTTHVERITQIVKLKVKVKSSSCDYSDACILVIKGTITVVGVGATKAANQTGRNDKQAVLKNFAPFTNCIGEINNTQLDNANIVML